MTPVGFPCEPLRQVRIEVLPASLRKIKGYSMFLFVEDSVVNQGVLWEIEQALERARMAQEAFFFGVRPGEDTCLIEELVTT